MQCKHPNCERLAFTPSKVKPCYCIVHGKRARKAKKLGKVGADLALFMGADLQPGEAWWNLTEAALAYADADSEDDKLYRRLCVRLQNAAKAYRDEKSD